VDGTSLLAQLIWSLLDRGWWTDERGANLLDGHAPFYDTYTCADGEHVAVAALEPPFYAALLDGLGLAGADLPDREDRNRWLELRTRFAKVFVTRTRDEWAAAFDGTDACVTPVLSFADAATHPHLVERATIIDPGGVRQAAPAPRFSRTPAGPRPTRAGLEDAGAVLADWSAPEKR
jgi:alpha-methylacyl-CoA racemase